MRDLINNDVWNDFESLFRPFDKNARTMRTDIKETEQHYELDIDMPGFDKDQINIELNKGYLTISAKKEDNQEESENSTYIRRERHFSAGRTYYVGDKIEEDKIKAKYKHGVLNVIVPKQQPKELPKHKIEID